MPDPSARTWLNPPSVRPGAPGRRSWSKAWDAFRPDALRWQRSGAAVKGLLRGPGCTERPAWGAEEAGVEAP